MKLGARSDLFACFGDERYKKMKEYGFDYADYCLDGVLGDKTEEEYQNMVLAEKALADEAGVTIHQVHGHWRFHPHDETEKFRAERAEFMRRSIRLAAMIGCKNWVIHPMMPISMIDKWRPSVTWEVNLQFWRDMLPYAKAHDVTVCFENMPEKAFSMSSVDKTLEFIREIDDDYFKLCLDTGHEAIFGSVGDAVRRAGKDLRVFHIHDNDGKGDLHWFPGMGVIDWKDFMEALREIGFDGVLSIESGSCKGMFPSASDDLRIRILKMLFDEIVAG